MDDTKRAHWRTAVHYKTQAMRPATPGPKLVRYYSVHEVARELGVTPATVSRWAAEGKLKGGRTSARGRWRFEAADVMRFLRGNVGAIRR